MNMIRPLLQDDALLADIAAAAADVSRVHLWWLGQSGFLVRWPGGHLLIDPYLSDSLTTKYAATDKPHVRMTSRVIDPRRLDFIDIVTSSHNHTDHLDADTLVPLIAANPTMRIIVPEANRQFVARRLNIDPASLIGMVDGGVQKVSGVPGIPGVPGVPGVAVNGIPAAHDDLAQDEQGRHHFMGYVFELPMNDGRTTTIYHSGDTLLFEGLADRLRRFEIDLAILPINGRGPERKVAGNLWGREAAGLAIEIGAKRVVPCHYDMFTFNTATPAEFIATCRKLDQPHHVLKAGERLSI